jgi:hypothetical protein
VIEAGPGRLTARVDARDPAVGDDARDAAVGDHARAAAHRVSKAQA